MYKMIQISAKTWNNTGLSVLKIHETDDVNKTLLLLLCNSDISKILGCANIYDLIDKKSKGNIMLKNERTHKRAS